MMRGLRVFMRFSNTPQKGRGEIDSNIENLLRGRRQLRESIREETLPADISVRDYYDSIVNITLYMRQDQWQSQYLYLLLNFHKLGFKRVSDLEFLDRASYLLDLRGKKDEERWPAVKVVVALEPKVILSGVSPISEFFRENAYFIEEVDRHSAQIENLQKHIDEQILPPLESLFWHPLLTYQYSFHTNLSSYISSRNNHIWGVLRKNGWIVLSRTTRNLINIASDFPRYQNSRQDFTRAICVLSNVYLTKKPFFGGSKPNHIDFYLKAQLLTRSGSYLFVRYLQEQIGGQFWRWWVRMAALCQYSSERVTTL